MGKKRTTREPKKDREKKAVTPELRLTELEMKSLELHKARTDMQSGIIREFQLKERLLQVEYQENRAIFRNKQAEAASSMEGAKQDYMTTVREIQERLGGINLSEFAVGDDGTLTNTGDMGEEEKAP